MGDVKWFHCLGEGGLVQVLGPISMVCWGAVDVVCFHHIPPSFWVSQAGMVSSSARTFMLSLDNPMLQTQVQVEVNTSNDDDNSTRYYVCDMDAFS